MKKLNSDLLMIKNLCEYSKKCKDVSDHIAFDGMTSYFLSTQLFENVIFRISLLVDDCFDELPDDLDD